MSGEYSFPHLPLLKGGGYFFIIKIFSMNKNQMAIINKYRECGDFTFLKMGEKGIFSGAKTRCNNPSRKDYERYGGRGIKFKFKNLFDFMIEVGERPSREFSIDRIDNNGHYERGNVKWSTVIDQVKNKRVGSKNGCIIYKGETARQASFRLGGGYSLVKSRIRKGWEKEEAFTKQVRSHKKYNYNKQK